MASEKQTRTLIYKRTHNGDPDPDTGVFGNNDCMKRVRGWTFHAVIGVGGIGREPRGGGIARKLTWVGIGPHKAENQLRPVVTFDHFLYYGEKGPLLEVKAPALARRIYNGGVRLIWDTSLSEKERNDVKNILDLAKNAPPSRRLEGAAQLNGENASGEHRSNSCCRNSVARKAEQENTVNGKEWRG